MFADFICSDVLHQLFPIGNGNKAKALVSEFLESAFAMLRKLQQTNILPHTVTHKSIMQL